MAISNKSKCLNPLEAINPNENGPILEMIKAEREPYTYNFPCLDRRRKADNSRYMNKAHQYSVKICNVDKMMDSTPYPSYIKAKNIVSDTMNKVIISAMACFLRRILVQKNAKKMTKTPKKAQPNIAKCEWACSILV